jgi:hypothetical protein
MVKKPLKKGEKDGGINVFPVGHEKYSSGIG